MLRGLFSKARLTNLISDGNTLPLKQSLPKRRTFRAWYCGLSEATITVYLFHSGLRGKNVLCFGKDTGHFVRLLHIAQSRDQGCVQHWLRMPGLDWLRQEHHRERAELKLSHHYCLWHAPAGNTGRFMTPNTSVYLTLQTLMISLHISF